MERHTLSENLSHMWGKNTSAVCILDGFSRQIFSVRGKDGGFRGRQSMSVQWIMGLSKNYNKVLISP